MKPRIRLSLKETDFLEEVARESENQGGFQIEELESVRNLGRGGFSRVDLMMSKKDKVFWAVKRSKPNNEISRDSLLNEIQIHKSLSWNQNIVAMSGKLIDAGTISVFYAYMEGGTLDDYINDNLCPLFQIWKWSIDIFNGLSCLHENGWIHRDLKPANILLDRLMGAKISDLGVAIKYLDLKNSALSSNRNLGTYTYFSPERFGAAEYSFSADIWSTGLIFLDLLLNYFTSNRLELGNSQVEVAESIQSIISQLELITDATAKRFLMYQLSIKPVSRLPAKMLKFFSENVISDQIYLS